jgi:hypothetical protein
MTSPEHAPLGRNVDVNEGFDGVSLASDASSGGSRGETALT